MSKDTNHDPCPACKGDGRAVDRTGGGHHGTCGACVGTGLAKQYAAPRSVFDDAERVARGAQAHAKAAGGDKFYIEYCGHVAFDRAMRSALATPPHQMTVDECIDNAQAEALADA